jgi:competence CoiA-like predicted nuclease
MPLRCLNPAGENILSLDRTDDEWEALTLENQRLRHLTLPCCGAKVVLKRSYLGTRFFAHLERGECTVGDEHDHVASGKWVQPLPKRTTIERIHPLLELKRIVVEAIRPHGWAISTEVVGRTQTGEQWRTDVLAQRGTGKIAVAIQWSQQTEEETLRLQEDWKRSGIRGLWLMAHRRFPVTQSVPAVCLGGSAHDGFTALILNQTEDGRWHPAMPLRDFIDAAFSRRFIFGDPVEGATTWGVKTPCWYVF